MVHSPLCHQGMPINRPNESSGPDIVRWTTTAEDAFSDLRTTLCTDAILVAPDLGKEFILQTDASDVGMGAVLSQMVGNDEHPIHFLSRKLLPRERKYTIVEKECLAVKWAVVSLRYYLLGWRFTLVTDHAPLQWMHQNKDKNVSVTRWFLLLQPFHFRVQLRFGIQHGNADGLSIVHCLPTQVVQCLSVEWGGEGDMW
ncbi:unnamed protein product [Eretmochelys imbricata]